MKKYVYYLYLLFLGLCLASLPACFSEIDFEGTGGELDNLVIQGKLIKGTPSIVTVSVRKVSDYEGAESSTAVEVANVILLDENQNAVDLIHTEPGIFKRNIPDGLLSIREGHAYQIRVVTKTGQIYESAPETLQPVPRPTAIDLTLIDREEINDLGNSVINTYLNFAIHTPLIADAASEQSQLKWEMEGCYRFIETTPANAPIPNPKTCYYKEVLSVEKIKVFNGKASSQENLSGHAFLETGQDHRFSRGYYLTVYQQSLTEAAYDYWEQVSQVVERTGGLFESKPGKIGGNIINVEHPEEEVFGFFYVTAQDTIRLHIKPEDADFPGAYCPIEATPADAVADFCYNCLLWPNSTLEKPAYWID